MANSGPAAVSYIVIPARMASTRLPRKMLLRETGNYGSDHNQVGRLRMVEPCSSCDYS